MQKRTTHSMKVANTGGAILVLCMCLIGCGSETTQAPPSQSDDAASVDASSRDSQDGGIGETDVVSADTSVGVDTPAVDVIIPSPDSVNPMDIGTEPPVVFGGERPATLQVPSSYDPAVPIPLVVILHGYFPKPGYVIAAFQMESFFEDMGVLTIAPAGTLNKMGTYFWNASPACCDNFGEGGDDVAYLASLIEDIKAAYNVDSKRVYAIGHSNGAFMVNTLACQRPDLLAGIISVAGAANPACIPTGTVSVLHAHATGDNIISYDGGMLAGVVYPGAVETVEYWAAANGCDLDSELVGSLDFNQFTPGEESQITRYLGCPDGIGVELWTEPNGPHLPRLPQGFAEVWWEWMDAHPKPE